MKSRTLSIFLGFLLLSAAAWPQEPTTKKLYTTRDTGKGITVTVDGKDYGPYEEISGTPYFDASLKSWAMVLRKADGRFSALVNGAEKGPFPETYENCSDISVGPDGTSWSMRADLGGNIPERMLRVVNGKEYGPFQFTGDFVWAPGAAPSGAAAASWYFRADSKGAQSLWVNGKKYGPYQDARDFAFDPTGAWLAFQYRGKDGVGIWVNGKEYGPYNDSRILRGPDWRFFGWTDTLKNGSQEITVGEKKYGPYAYVDGRLYVSGDRKRWLVMVVKNNASYLLSNEGEEQMERLEVVPLKEGFLYHRNKGSAQYIVTDKGQFGPYENIMGFSVIPEQSSWALSYLKGDGGSQVPTIVVNGTEYRGEGLKSKPGADGFFSWVAVADDGSAVYASFQKELSTKTLYTTEKSDTGLKIFMGPKNLGPYERLIGAPAASLDGKNWGILAAKGDGKVSVIVNGAEVSSLDVYARVEDFSLSNSGAVWSVTAMKEDKGGAPRYRVISGIEYGPFEVDTPTVYAEDGQGWLFWTAAAGKNGQAYLYMNAKKLGPYQSGDEDKVYDFARGKLALRERSADGAFVWVNDKKLGPYKDVEILRTGAERSMEQFAGFFGFIGTLKNGTQELYVDGDKTYGPFASMNQGRRYISRDGKTWIFGVRKPGTDRDIMLMNGGEAAVNGYDVAYTRAGYVMMVRKNGREYLQADQKISGPYERVQSWQVSSDGSVWAGEAVRIRGNSRYSVIVVNGKEYPGEKLTYAITKAGESFSWISYEADGSGVLNTVKVK